MRLTLKTLLITSSQIMWERQEKKFFFCVVISAHLVNLIKLG